MEQKQRKIELTKGLFAIVDDSDFEFLSQFKWHATNCDGKHYATTHLKKGNALIRMHTLLLPFAVEVDHKNGDGLDNRRENLRPATRSQNKRNIPKRKNMTSKYLGVSLYHNGVSKNKWCARVQINRKHIWLGAYPTEEEAAIAFNNGCIKHGVDEFTRLNVINS